MYDLKEKTKEMASFVIGTDSDTFKNFDYDDEIRFLNRPERKECSFLQILILGLSAEEIRDWQEMKSF